MSRPDESAERGAPAFGCAHCGFPVRSPGSYCCYGCVLASQIAGTISQRGEPSWILARLGLSAFLTMNVMGVALFLYAGDPAASPGPGGADPAHLAFAQIFRWVLLVFSAPVVALLGWPIFASGLGRPGGRTVGVDSLIAVGTLAAYGLSAWSTLRGSGHVYFETACMILVLVTLGRYLESRARTSAGAGMRDLLSDRYRIATVRRGGDTVEVPSAEVAVGETVLVRAGSVVPVDGVIVEGEGGIDESTLTGEPLPALRRAGDTVHAGTASVDGTFLVRVTAGGDDRLAARLARLLEEARLARAPIERLADRVAAVFTPAAVALALMTAVAWGLAAGAAAGVMNGLSVLLIACPCALGLATPLVVWKAIGVAARRGIVIRGGATLERIPSVRSFFFDKTGTLTERAIHLDAIVPAPGHDPDRILRLAAAVESVSTHPMALAVGRAARERGLVPFELQRFRVHPGIGVEGEVRDDTGEDRRAGGAASLCKEEGGTPGDDRSETPDGARPVAIGGTELLSRLGIPRPVRATGAGAHSAFVIESGEVVALLRFSENLRGGAKETMGDLAGRGLSVEVLTGDASGAGRAVIESLGVGARSGVSAEGKLDAVVSREATHGATAMVGEGLNDAPAAARATVSFALGCGSDATREAADVILLRDDPSDIPWVIDLSKRTMRVIRFNLAWAFAYNVILIPLAATGRLQPVAAALAMIASSLFVTANSLRIGRGSEAAVHSSVVPSPAGHEVAEVGAS